MGVLMSKNEEPITIVKNYDHIVIRPLISLREELIVKLGFRP